jgi:hypothetical protein
MQWPLHHWSKCFGSCAIWRSKNFFHNLDFMGIKRRRILRRFQKSYPLLIPMKSLLWEKKILDPKKLWPIMKRSLGQKNLFCYFRYFWKVYNKSQGYFCWKCIKKVENQPTLIYSIRHASCCCGACMSIAAMCFIRAAIMSQANDDFVLILIHTQ